LKLYIFDDAKWQNFFPLTFTRSTGDLRVGILKLRQRILGYMETEETNVIVPQLLQEIYRERQEDWDINSLTQEDSLFINSRLKIDDELVKKINALESGNCLMSADAVIAARFSPKASEVNSESISSLLENLKAETLEDNLCWEYLWELIHANGKYIKRDFQEFFYDKDNSFETEMGVTVLDPYNFWIGDDAKLSPGNIIDCSGGPVVIDEGAKIMPNAVIIGPCYIGKKSTIKIGAKIYENTSIGPVCKVGGEVEGSIIQAFSNKQHDGFLGHSYLGEWVNLGADTNNSDLKNTYKNVKSWFYPAADKIDTGSMFVGCLLGDHSKTGINCAINTGTVMGVACNLYGSPLINGFIPSFSWGEANSITKYRLDKFLETATAVKKRRSLPLSDAEKELYNNLCEMEFELTV